PPLNAEDGGAGRVELKHVLAGVDAGLKDGMVCLTGGQLRQILSSIQTSGYGQHGPEEQTAQGGTAYYDENGAWRWPALKVSHSQIFLSRGRFLQSGGDARTQKFAWTDGFRSAGPGVLSVSFLVGEYAESVLSVGHREQPAAIRSSLILGEVTPMEEVLNVERKEEQRRRWLEELDRQREETAERRKREKLLQRQTEDHERWAAHFDSLQRRAPIQPPVPSAPPPGQLSGSEREDWDPSSSLSLVWEATSSCGAESVIGASVDSTRGYPSRSSYLRTMTSLLDPAQIAERERRKLKQLEQQVFVELPDVTVSPQNNQVPQTEQPETGLGDGGPEQTSESKSLIPVSASLLEQRTLLLLLLSHLQQAGFGLLMSPCRTTCLPLALLSLLTAGVVQREQGRRTSVCRQKKIRMSRLPGRRRAGKPRGGPNGTPKG
ncbi:hypothetical protein XENOCAPTIV_023873, partial [Xenoophorus captivus]